MDIGLRFAFYLLPFAFCLTFAVGCRMDMQDQPRYEVYESSTSFKDGMASRPLVQGTVPRGYLKADTELYTGKIDRSQSVGSTTVGQSAGGRAAGNDGAQPEGQAAAPQTGREAQGANAPDTAARADGTARSSGAMAQGDPNDVETFPFPITAEVVNRGQERYKIYCAMCHGATGYGDGMIVRRGFRKPPSYHTEELRAARVGHIFDVITNGWGSMPSYNAEIPVRDRWAIIAYVRALQLSRQNATAAPAPGAQPPPTGGPK